MSLQDSSVAVSLCCEQRGGGRHPGSEQRSPRGTATSPLLSVNDEVKLLIDTCSIVYICCFLSFFNRYNNSLLTKHVPPTEYAPPSDRSGRILATRCLPPSPHGLRQYDTLVLDDVRRRYCSKRRRRAGRSTSTRRAGRSTLRF